MTYDTYINPVSLIQKWAIRSTTLHRFTAHSTPIFLDLKILKSRDFFQLKLLCSLYYCINALSPSCFNSFFVLVEGLHQYGTRQVSNNDIFLSQKNSLQYGLRSVRYCEAKCWDGILESIKILFAVNSKPSSLKMLTVYYRAFSVKTSMKEVRIM